MYIVYPQLAVAVVHESNLCRRCSGSVTKYWKNAMTMMVQEVLMINYDVNRSVIDGNEYL